MNLTKFSKPIQQRHMSSWRVTYTSTSTTSALFTNITTCQETKEVTGTALQGFLNWEQNLSLVELGLSHRMQRETDGGCLYTIEYEIDDQ